MEVIMLSGPSSSGKTTVINEVYKMLTGNYFYPSNKHKDFECTIQYNGKMIAFKSAGDESRNPIEAMRNYKTLNFDVLICAHNTNKVNPLKEILKYKHVIIQKSQPYKDNASCLIDANQIFNQININKMTIPTQVPTNLQHKPIIAVNNYAKIDAIYAHDTDTVALSIGKAQYDNNHISAKVWRYKSERWSRQSEELPIHRALDLSILTIASFITDVNSAYSLTSLREEIIDYNEITTIQDYYKKNEHMLKPRLEELRKVLNVFFDKSKL